MKTYIVFDATGRELARVKTISRIGAKNKAKKLYGKYVFVTCAEI